MILSSEGWLEPNLYMFRKPDIDVCSQIVATMFIASQVSRLATCHMFTESAQAPSWLLPRWHHAGRQSRQPGPELSTLCGRTKHERSSKYSIGNNEYHYYPHGNIGCQSYHSTQCRLVRARQPLQHRFSRSIDIIEFILDNWLELIELFNWFLRRIDFVKFKLSPVRFRHPAPATPS